MGRDSRYRQPIPIENGRKKTTHSCNVVREHFLLLNAWTQRIMNRRITNLALYMLFMNRVWHRFLTLAAAMDSSSDDARLTIATPAPSDDGRGRGRGGGRGRGRGGGRGAGVGKRKAGKRVLKRFGSESSAGKNKKSKNKKCKGAANEI